MNIAIASFSGSFFDKKQDEKPSMTMLTSVDDSTEIKAGAVYPTMSTQTRPPQQAHPELLVEMLSQYLIPRSASFARRLPSFNQGIDLFGESQTSR